jgi:hypothetical protein
VARAAVIGEPLRIYGYGLAGALLYPASDRPDVVHAWQDLPGDVAVVLVTRQASQWLEDEIALKPEVLPVVMPDPVRSEAGLMPVEAPS